MAKETGEMEFNDAHENDHLGDAIAKSLVHSGLRRVSVEVDDQRIVLSGTVSSFYLKQVAQETARQTCPSRQVYNDVDVVQS